MEKNRENVVGDPSLVFHAKQLLMKLLFVSLPTCNSIVGIDASHLYPFSMCQPMPTGLCTRWDLDPGTIRFTLRQNKTCSFESIVMFCFYEQDQIATSRASIQQADKRKLTASVLTDFVLIATLFSKHWTAFTIFIPVKKCDRLASKRVFNVAVKREREREISANSHEALYERHVSKSVGV